MKKIVFALVVTLTAFVSTSCTDESEEIVPQQNTDLLYATEGGGSETIPPRD